MFHYGTFPGGKLKIERNECPGCPVEHGDEQVYTCFMDASNLICSILLTMPVCSALDHYESAATGID